MGFPSAPVTLLFTGIEGSIRRPEADPEAIAEAAGRYHRIVREKIEVSGGHVFKTAGEAFRTVFANPADAMASAVASQRAAACGRAWWPGPGVRSDA